MKRAAISAILLILSVSCSSTKYKDCIMENQEAVDFLMDEDCSAKLVERKRIVLESIKSMCKES